MLFCMECQIQAVIRAERDEEEYIQSRIDSIPERSSRIRIRSCKRDYTKRDVIFQLDGIFSASIFEHDIWKATKKAEELFERERMSHWIFFSMIRVSEYYEKP